MDFDTAFIQAVAAVAEAYVRVPIADSAPVVRERAFAYELYHQLRESCAISGYTLTGELEKAAHPDLRNSDVKRLAPDLLVHVPGDRRGNHVAIEIKGGRPGQTLFRKTLPACVFSVIASVMSDSFTLCTVSQSGRRGTLPSG
jgi:hypothetical protein